MAVVVEKHGNRYKHKRNAAQECAGPVDAHGLEHVLREEGEARTGERTEEGVGCDGGCGTKSYVSIIFLVGDRENTYNMRYESTR